MSALLRDPEFHDNPDFPLTWEPDARPKRTNFWLVLSRGMELVIYVLLVVAMVKLFQPQWEKQKGLDVEAARLDVIRNDKDQQVARLKQEHRLLKTDKEYLETAARDRLKMQRAGEYIVRIERSADTAR